MYRIQNITVLFFMLLSITAFCSFPIAAQAAEDSGHALESTLFPEEELFKPLLAYYRQPKFFMSYRRYHVKTEPYDDTFNVGAVGYGTIFGIYGLRDPDTGDGFQAGFGGGLLAQFNLDAPSLDLVNADYSVGFPFTFRRGATSARFSIYHQSSHLGDEFLLRFHPKRVNFSYEALEFVLSHEWDGLRIYGGGEYMYNHEPVDFDPFMAHAGVEYYLPSSLTYIGQYLAGVDVMSYQEHDWHLDVSAKAGVEISSPSSRRNVRLLLEGYRGYAPHGQFYEIEIYYFGAGMYFGI